jgi:EAL domain-containing protein (putative c-di-GMP-specific phosphodiesterase class I)
MALQLIAKSSEVKLAEAINDIADFADWHAVHFNFNRLRDEYKSDYQIKIAINLINDLLKAHSGSIFILSDRGIVVLCDGAEKTLISKLVFQLRYLYMDDPLAYREDGQENSSFSTLYELASERGAFVNFVSQRMAGVVRKSAPARSRTEEPVTDVGAAVADLDASLLAGVEDNLRRANVLKSVRRQPVCAVLPGGVKKVFDELYIHIAHLRRELEAEVDFFSNRWLFKYLTQILDQRMLTLTGADPKRYFETPVSLNLNAETLLSSTFSEFDARIPAAMKVGIVLEVPIVDVFADITGFIVARSEVQKLGYRICLDGLNAAMLANIDREKLKADLVKVQWNADAQSDLRSQENKDLVAAITRCGSKRIILCRCDTKQAVDYGQALGISLFQGRYIDGLLNPTAMAMEN